MLSHIDKDKQASMVDISGKENSDRMALAYSLVQFPQELRLELERAFSTADKQDFITKKGSVKQVAIIAGIQAVKQTSSLIPLCHPLLLSKCEITIEVHDLLEWKIFCRVLANGKTGVEMEALMGASIAALSIYDMTKAVSKKTVIKETKLLEKTGGKSDLLASI